MTKVKFKDADVVECEAGTTFFDLLAAHDKAGLKKAAAVRVDGVVVDLSSTLADSSEVVVLEPVPLESPEGLEISRHSTAHVMAEAVKSLYENVRLGIGPNIEDGFYYDFDVETPFTPEDLKAVEDKMREIIRGNHPFEREDLSKEDAAKLFGSLEEPYKLELIGEIEGAGVSIYRQGGFVDLCRGPHLPRTGWIKAFKLTRTAGAYWRGSEKNKMLARIYGTAFASKAELKAYLQRIEEAKKRDHRKIGRELDLFSTSEEIGAGLALWHPKGAALRNVIEDFWRGQHTKGGYELIFTPHIARVELWKKSGHWDFYRESLFSPMDVDGQDYIVKPMNCPFHIEIYKSRLRSYRELPIRYAELGTVYRYERSGVLHGLLRVRGFTQDDAHIFMRPDQLNAEIRGVINFTLYILKSFGFNEFEVYLSTRPEKFVGSVEDWDAAESALKGALVAENLAFEIDPGEGVFYGPKIDIKIRDVLGRSWQCSTIQVDFNLPERFDVTYRDSEGAETRPIMIHRALMGSLERFIGCLIEHYAGAFPAWLAPVQVVVMTVTERNDEYAHTVFEKLNEAGIRVECDTRNEKLGFKIREAQLKKIPFQLVVGDNETADKTVSPRERGGKTTPAVTVEEFIGSVVWDRPQ